MSSVLNVSPEQLKIPPKRIGWINKNPVYRLLTKGGLNIVLAKFEKGTKVLGTGNHIAIAKAIAKKNEDKDLIKELIFDELSKSEDLPYEQYSHLIPFWEKYTQKFDQRLAETLIDG